VPPTILALVRHGEIVRPVETSNFDPAPLSDAGRRQITGLAESWPMQPPDALYASPLRRAIESAETFASTFHRPIVVRRCLREWAADTSGIPQADYVALEARAWADLDLVPPAGESLRMAAARIRSCVEEIAGHHPGETVVLMGHGTLFSLLTAALRGIPPSPAYKASIGFAHTAILEAGSGLRLRTDFRSYGT
jgi:broad specificity phosphatase PhoE